MPEGNEEEEMSETTADRELRAPDTAVPEAAPAMQAPPAPVERVLDGRKAKTIDIRDVNLYYGDFLAVQGVGMQIQPNKVTALIGSSGCGKTTFLRSINRMHELTPGARVEGEIVLDGANIYDPHIDPVLVRRLVGMVFQAPNPFPTMSIAENVAAGLTLNSRKMKKSEKEAVVERSLRGAHLWDEVKDRLDKPGGSLSGGQQQRLCIARTIAVEPEVILMDEPCSALDPVATLAVEDLIQELKQKYTVVIVTHNMQQASRASDVTAFFNLEKTGEPGRLVEIADTQTIFSNPSRQATEDYVSGRFG
jgi:phosphate transport system ATP-binding protein